MGIVENISFNKFPEQGNHVGQRVLVAFNYDLNNTIGGVIIRDDAESPWRTIIQLDNGRVVLATECQYRPAPEQ